MEEKKYTGKPFRILVDESPDADFFTLEEARRAYDEINVRPARKQLVQGHWQGAGEWENFVIDKVIK